MSRIVILSFLAILSGTLIFYLGHPIWILFTSEEIGSKPEWSILQDLEYKFRDTTQESHMLIKKSSIKHHIFLEKNYWVPGILSDNRKSESGCAESRT